jgi:5-methylcytosine-specific restriction endonuclease McrA
MPTDADYDARRGSARARGYDAQWDRAARLFKALRPLCLGCEAIGLIVAAEVVDHVLPHKGDMVLFWDQNRWQPCCRWHHDVVKQQLEHAYANGRAVEADLWLNSAKAIAVTKRERTSVGDDGWLA